jgi:hypothetical protein
MNPDTETIPARFQRSTADDCIALGDYVPASVQPDWNHTIHRHMAPRGFQRPMEYQSTHYSQEKRAMEAPTIWVFEPRTFQIGGARVTMFVRIR